MKPIYKILTLHFFIIFLLGAISYSLPSDMIENLIWGRTLNFASDKHPPFLGWQSYLAVKLFGGNLMFYHILTPINQVIFLFFLYLIAVEILKNEEKAIACVVLLQSVVFHSFYYKFNANTANLAFFGAIYYTFYKMLKEGKYYLYPVIGALCAVIMLIKYSGILLIGTIGVITLITPEGRKSLKSPYLFLGIAIFIAMLTPYVLNLFAKGGDSAISYLLEQSESERSKLIRLPRFILLQALPFLPMLIAFFAIKTKRLKQSINFDYIFLTVGFALPLLLTIGYILVKQADVGFFWLSMYYGLSAILLFYFYDVKAGFLNKVYKIIYPIFAIMFVIYFITNVFNAEDDNKKIASFLEEVRKEEGITSDYYICMDSRRMCGIVILYGTDYSTSVMHISKWKTGLQFFEEEAQKPSNFIIIGGSPDLKIEGYTLKYHHKLIYQYYKFDFVEKFFSSNSFLSTKIMSKLGKPLMLVAFTTAKKNDEYAKPKKQIS